MPRTRRQFAFPGYPLGLGSGGDGRASLIMGQEGMRMPADSETQGNPFFKLPFDIQSGNDRAVLKRM
jgi:hypothetical protein